METKLLCSILLFLTISIGSAWELTGTDMTAQTGSSVKLTCKIIPDQNYTGNLFHHWKDVEDQDILFIDQVKVLAEDRMMASFNENEMVLEMSYVTLDDEGLYECSILGSGLSAEKEIALTVHMLPKVYVENFDVEVEHEKVDTVATCFANASKPAPTMWFTDQDGKTTDVLEQMQTVEGPNGLFDTILTLKRKFTKKDHLKEYTCHVRHIDGDEFSEQTDPISVLYTSSITLSGAYKNEHIVLEEGKKLQVLCSPDGYPTPTVEWSFTPDINTNISMPADQTIPSNCALSGDGRTLTCDAVTLSDAVSTNNGTFECQASNSIGSDRQSFRLGVYAVPVTTVATTTVLTETRIETSGIPPVVEPRSAGSDAAVIGGVVAVAVFVLIVAVVLIVRYFMSHKGTYHTHETKPRDMEDDQGHGSDEHNLMADDENELGEKKRTEYFM